MLKFFVLLNQIQEIEKVKNKYKRNGQEVSKMSRLTRKMKNSVDLVV